MNNKRYLTLKRFFDVFVSIVALIVLSPFLLIFSVLLLLTNKGKSIFFFQQRLGLREVPFKIIKFKTMNDCSDADGRLLADSSRITPLGKLLRRLKFDELPQLINVIKGDMAIVGPRPCLPSMKARFGKYSDYRFKVRPGLTSLAAVRGSVFLTWDRKGIYDYIYVRKISLALDMYIIYRTFYTIIFGEKKLFSK